MVTLEGIYVVSLGDYWCDNVDELSEFVKTKDKSYKFIMNNLDAEYPYRSKKSRKNIPFDNPHQFVKHANSLTLNGKQVLVTQYIPWDAAKMEFQIRSPLIRSECKLSAD